MGAISVRNIKYAHVSKYIKYYTNVMTPSTPLRGYISTRSEIHVWFPAGSHGPQPVTATR